MAYTPQVWLPGAAGGTPLSAARFTVMEAGIEDADNRLTATEASVAGKVSAVTAGDATVTVAGTATSPTVAVNAIPQSKVTGLVVDLAAKATPAQATSTAVALSLVLGG